MRGCIRRAKEKDSKTGKFKEQDKRGLQKGEHSFDIILSLGLVGGKYKQRWVRFNGTRKEAEKKLTELTGQFDRGELLERSKITVGQWFTKWFSETVKLTVRASTYDSYRDAIENHIAPALGDINLQSLRPGHIKQYHLERVGKLAGATLQMHHVILNSALKSAMKNELLTKNVATLVDGRPRAKKRGEDAKENCWTLEETQTVLAAAKDEGPQYAALFHLAVDTGMRRNELCGLKWGDLDLDEAKVTVERQLVIPRWTHKPGCKRPKRMRPAWETCPQCGSARPSREPQFGPTKTGQLHTIDITDETVRLLRDHKRTQAELKMANRKYYKDHGLVFAREWSDVRNCTTLGLPLNPDDLSFRTFQRIAKKAKVRRIKFHGLRHTSATLLLGSSEPAHVVAQRLGHANANTTLAVYAHALPSQQRSTAVNFGALLGTTSSFKR